MPPRKRGPEPTLRSPKRLTAMVEWRALRAVDAYAKGQRINRSEAVRVLLALGLRKAEDDAGTAEAPEAE